MSTPPPVPKRLVVSTYRQLLRLSLRLDTDPALRSIVCVSPSAVYSGEMGCWRGLSRNSDVAPAEQYLEDVLRFANLTSDFHLADPEQVTPNSWKTSNLLYPKQRFVSNNKKQQKDAPGNMFDQKEPAADQQDGGDAPAFTSLFRHYPLSYLARLHFRGGPELQQFKTEMQAAVKEAHLRRSSGSGGNPSTPSAASSTAAAAASSSSGGKSNPASLDAPPTAAQLGAGFHCVRWLRNLIQVVRADHPSLGTTARLSANDLFSGSSAPGQLEFVPCYRAPLRQRWRLGSDEPASSSSFDDSATEQGFLGALGDEEGEAGKKEAVDVVVEDEPPAEETASSGGKMTGKEAARRLMLLRSKRLAEAKAARKQRRGIRSGDEPSSSSSPSSSSAAAAADSGREPIFSTATQLVHRPYTDSHGSTWTDVPSRVTGHAPSAFFLCAHPVMPGFFLGNVLLMHHIDPNHGAVGFTINRPLRNNDGVPVPVWAVFAHESQSPTAVLRHLEDNRIFVAGPVSIVPPPMHGGGVPAGAASSAGGGPSQREHDFLSVAHFLHRIPDVPFAQPVAPGVWWGGDQTVLGQKLESKEASPRDVMVLIGHAGWGAQQLEGEICNGSWLTAVSRSRVDDRIFKETGRGSTGNGAGNGGDVKRPFASPRVQEDDDANAAAAAAAGAEKQQVSEEAEGKSSEKQDSAAADEAHAELPAKFDTVADYIFAGNIPISKEERLLEFKKKDPDCLVHMWREFVLRLGVPSLKRLSELTPDGEWMTTANNNGSNSEGGSKPSGPGADARARASGGATGAGTPGRGGGGKPNV